MQYPDLNDVQWEYTVETEENNGHEEEKNEECEPPIKRIKTSDCKVICDIPILAEGLKSCQYCGNPLSLSHCEEMKCHGLGTQLYVKCYNGDCRKTNIIDLGNRHRIHKHGPKAWNINTRAAAAMIHSGIGERQLNNFLGAVNLNCIDPKALKRYENEVGEGIEAMAEESMNKALDEEWELTEWTEESDVSSINNNHSQSSNSTMQYIKHTPVTTASDDSHIPRETSKEAITVQQPMNNSQEVKSSHAQHSRKRTLESKCDDSNIPRKYAKDSSTLPMSVQQPMDSQHTNIESNIQESEKRKRKSNLPVDHCLPKKSSKVYKSPTCTQELIEPDSNNSSLKIAIESSNPRQARKRSREFKCDDSNTPKKCAKDDYTGFMSLQQPMDLERNSGSHLKPDSDNRPLKTAADTHQSRKRTRESSCDNSDVPKKKWKKMRGSSDCQWMRRGAGKAYNSLTGHVTLMGHETRKCIGMAVRSKDCTICKWAKRNKKTPRFHKCGMNWKGSAKAMEADGVVELLKRCKARGKPIHILDGDDDTSAITKVRREVDCNIEKVSDKGHLVKNLGKQLQSIKSSHPELTHSVIKYLQKNFKYMVSQNQGNVEGIIKGKKAVVDHAFGIHTNCDSSWCGYLQNPSKFKHKGIPGGADLKSTDLKKAVETIYDVDPKILAFLGSSQGNESLNGSVGSKAQKRVHYGGSNSFKYRANSGMLQKNEGYQYVPNLMEWLCLSPNRSTNKRARKLDALGRKRKVIDALPKTKRRRQMLKAQRSSQDFSEEIQEGVTYKSNMMIKEPEQVEESEVPPVMEKPTEAEYPIESIPDDISLIFFDFETTGLERDSDILQIAAKSTDKVFDIYMVPKHKKISQGASKTNKIAYKYGVLKVNGQPVDAVFPEVGLKHFVEFICSFNNPVLVGHNVKNFDCLVLHNKLDGELLAQIQNKEVAYVDTCEVFKDAFPGRESYKQCDLVMSLLKHNYDAHNALADVTALQELCGLVSIDVMKKHAFSIDYIMKTMEYDEKVKANNATLSHLVISKACSKDMAKRIASSGLAYGHLKFQVRENGYDGLEALLKKQTSQDKPRVTKERRVIKKLFDKIFAAL